MNERSIEDFNRLLERCETKSVSQTIQNVGGPVSDDNTGYIKQEMSLIDADMTPRQVTLYSMRSCSCGKLVTEGNPIQGRCQHRNCANFNCSECVRTCQRCRRNFCSRHVTRFGPDEVYCSRCLPFKIIGASLKMFFNQDYGRSKE